MANPPKLKLLERRRGVPFQTVHTIRPGQPIPMKGELKLGSQASLRDEKKVEILVRITAIEGDALSGEIEDFPGHGPTYLGMKLGDTLTFRETNVFSG